MNNLEIQRIKRFLKPFIVIFLASFLFFNWNGVSWIFNYRFLSDALSPVLEESNQTASLINENNIFERGEYVEKENSIEIPKIGVVAPLIMPADAEDSAMERELKKGVVYYPESVLPGENGQTVILGHSAPLGWPKIKYDWVFSDLSKLEEGDEIIVYSNNQRYVYKAKDKIFLDKGEDAPSPLTNSENSLLLLSCWPPGKDYKRIAVRAELNN